MRRKRLLFMSLLNYLVWTIAGAGYSIALAIAYVLELLLDLTGVEDG